MHPPDPRFRDPQYQPAGKNIAVRWMIVIALFALVVVFAAALLT